MENKKAEMTIGVLVAIILGLIVLVVIALGFSMGWGELWDKVNVFGGGSSLASVGQACQIACTTKDATSWCSQPQTIKGLPKSAEYLTTTPGNVKWYTDSKGRIEGISCDLLHSKNKITISQDQCSPDFTCTDVVPSGVYATSPNSQTKKCADLAGTWQAAVCTNTQADLTSQVTDTSDKGTNVACCK